MPARCCVAAAMCATTCKVMLFTSIAAAAGLCHVTVRCPLMDVQANEGEVSELTLGYNFGRLHEANGDLKQAQTLFSVSPTRCCDHVLSLCSNAVLCCLKVLQPVTSTAKSWGDKNVQRAAHSKLELYIVIFP